MQSDVGKLFIGGISWDTNEERLRDYFSRFGEVLEAVIMKDHTTGRARGFGFVVFADPAVAESVIKEKHSIDGRMVEAKKAVPRDEQSTINRSSSSIQGSPSTSRTRKIFVGGLASNVTENDFKTYFEQFGTVTDAVVMYDHVTQRPRGFGFITYETEEAVETVLVKTYHELNGKTVEVKRAVPRELSPSPSRAMLGAYPYGLGRTGGAFFNNAVGGVGGYGVRMAGRGGFGPFGSLYGMGGLNFETGMVGPNFNRSLGYGRGTGPSPYRSVGPYGLDGGNGGTASFFSSNPQSLWGNTGLNSLSNSNESSMIGGGVFRTTGADWGSDPNINHSGMDGPAQRRNLGYGGDDSYRLGLGVGGYGRNAAVSEVQTPQHAAANSGYERSFSEFYVGGSGGRSGGSLYGGDPTWRAGNSGQEGSGSFGGYGLGDGNRMNLL